MGSIDTSDKNNLVIQGNWTADTSGMTTRGHIVLAWDESYGVLYSKDFTIT